MLIPESTLKSTVLLDRHGDALDSIIAAFATFRAIRKRNLIHTEVLMGGPDALEAVRHLGNILNPLSPLPSREFSIAL